MSNEKSQTGDPTMRTIRALADESHDFRTAEGVSREAGVELGVAQSILTMLVEFDVARSLKGESDLYTLASRPMSAREKHIAKIKKATQ